jgi:hypothetical protein
MKPNVMLNLFGLSLILIALLGIAVVGPEEEHILPPEFVVYEIPFIDMAGTVPSMGVVTADGQTQTTSITVDTHNLTSVSFTISWEDQRPASGFAGDVTVEVTVVGPTGESDMAADSGQSGSFSFEFTDLNRGRNSTEELRILIDEDINDKALEKYPAQDGGMGDWEFTISVTRERRPTAFSTQTTIGTNYEFYTMGEPQKL